MQIAFKDLVVVRQRHGQQIIVLVGGCYDLLHVAHLGFLRNCRNLGNILVVAASADKRVQERKGLQRPIIPEDMRVEMLAAINFVDYALVAPDPVAGDEPPTVKIIRSLRPDIFATSDPHMYDYADSVRTLGTIPILLPEVKFPFGDGKLSTTAIIDSILNEK